eukprot:TRINITY_DN1714_c0_g1_i1.p1 TRINITY_DN1714_c0_g1~~TRINITY_DN1714_c0_g1_i1.p1  ORF type:complete len:440 (-),score=147.27 TRINITY_DN1714_c0_g1_i1:138-1457(-)
MKNLMILLFLFSTLLCIAFGDCGNQLEPWVTKTSCPSDHREGAAQAMPDGKLYIFSGFYTNDLLATNRLDIYDVQADLWTEGKPMPAFGNVTHCQSAAWVRSSLVPAPKGVGRTIFLAGGFLNKHPGSIYNEVWKYDTVDNEWTRLPDLPLPRASAGVAIDSRDRLHFISGLENRYNESLKHWTLNLRVENATWEDALDAIEAKNHFPAVPFGDWIYTPGGVKGHDGDSVIDQITFERFQSEENRWERLQDLPEPRSHVEASTMFVNNRMVQFGGRNKNPGYPGVLKTVAEYDIQSNSWQFLRSLPFVSTTPTVGFFQNLTVDGVLGDYIVMTVGGIDWDNGRRDTYVSRVTFNCTVADPGPTYAVESEAAEATNESSSQDSNTNVSPQTSAGTNNGPVDQQTGANSIGVSNTNPSNGSGLISLSISVLALGAVTAFCF